MKLTTSEIETIGAEATAAPKAAGYSQVTPSRELVLGIVDGPFRWWVVNGEPDGGGQWRVLAMTGNHAGAERAAMFFAKSRETILSLVETIKAKQDEIDALSARLRRMAEHTDPNGGSILHLNQGEG